MASNTEEVAQYAVQQHLARYFAFWNLERHMVVEYRDGFVTDRKHESSTHWTGVLLVSMLVSGCLWFSCMTDMVSAFSKNICGKGLLDGKDW